MENKSQWTKNANTTDWTEWALTQTSEEFKDLPESLLRKT